MATFDPVRVMELAQVNFRRNLASKIGAVFCIIALLALVDGLLVHFREPSNVVKVLPGAVIEVNGELTDEAQGVEDLTYISNSDQLTITFLAIHKGYFLGGDMWRGRLQVGPHLSPGEYNLAVIPKRANSPRKAPDFRVLVFPDAATLQKNSISLIRQWFWVSPFKVAAACLPGILLAFGAVYLLSGRREALLAAAGKAEIYRVTRTEGGCEIRFGLGTSHGLTPGAKVFIYNNAGTQMGTATVEVSSQTYSVAQATSDEQIKVGYLVQRL